MDLYNPQHPFITYSSFHGPDKSTPYACNTDGTPMYRATFQSNPPNILSNTTNSSRARCQTGSPQPPHGFTINRGENYIHFPITDEQGQVFNAHFVQLIMGTNPMVIGLQDESSHVYAAPCYACPQLSFDARPHYPEEDLIIFDIGYDERRKIDAAIAHLKDPSVRAEVHRYRSASGKLDHLEQLLIYLEAKWGELAAQKLGAIRCLEMANTMAHIGEVQRDEVDMEERRGRRP